MATPSTTERETNSPLAHLAGRLTDRTETLATEALGYILSRSDAARSALRDALKPGGDVGTINHVKTEVRGEHAERVDLVGYEKEGGPERVLIEAKFWAGLTEHQPNTYLERLGKSVQPGLPAVLLFVAPEKRLETLWAEVLRRADGRLSEIDSAKRCATVDGGPHLAMLTSWRALLEAMSARAGDAGESAAARDILQLMALCEREDEDAFLPIKLGEFGPEIPRRLLNLNKLIDDATDRARRAGFCDTSRLQATPQRYGYGRYIRIGAAGGGWGEAWFGVDYRKWASEAETPIWLNFVDSNTGHMPMDAIRRKLGHTCFYFALPAGVEYDAVLDEIVASLRAIAAGLTDSDEAA